jgi:penicillin-binding protein 1A
VASIGLGSFDVSLYEMVGAYSAFVNEGIHAEPLLVSEIQDQNGNVIQQFDPQIKRVIKKESAQLLLNMLQGTIYEGGTGSSLLWGDGAKLLPEKIAMRQHLQVKRVLLLITLMVGLWG